jgi:hypothetical protein
MLIIDAHVHVSAQDYPTAQTLKTLQQFNIERAIIFADPKSADLASENLYVLRSGQEFNCYPFYYLGGNPYTDTRMDLEVPENLNNYAGLRWHGWFSEARDLVGRIDRHELEFAVNVMESPIFEALMAALAHYRMPIIFEEDFGVTLEFVARFSNLSIIIPHLGAFSGGEERVIEELYRSENVYFSTGQGRLNPVLARRIGPERLLYASDFPYGSPGDNIAEIERLGFNEEDEALILGENAERLLEAQVERRLS